MKTFKTFIIALAASSLFAFLCPSVLAASQSGYYTSKFHGSTRAFPSNIRPPGAKIFVFSPKYKAWAAYWPDGRLAGYGRASGGSNWCKEIGRVCRTPRGAFSIRSKGGYECYSSKYPLPRGGAHMPYCMFFHKGYAIHGAPPQYVPSNANVSHGCIRVTTDAARWLRDNFLSIGTRVYVTSY